MAELALDDVHGYPLPGELHRVRMTQLMRREPPAHPGFSGELAQLHASGGRRPPPTAGGSIDDAEQRADGKRYP